MLLNFSTLGFSARMATTADLPVRCVPLAPRLAPATAAPPSTAAAKPAAPTEAAPVAPVAMVPTCPWLRSWPCCATGATKALALAVKAAGINSDLAISAKKIGSFWGEAWTTRSWRRWEGWQVAFQLAFSKHYKTKNGQIPRISGHLPGKWQQLKQKSVPICFYLLQRQVSSNRLSSKPGRCVCAKEGKLRLRLEKLLILLGLIHFTNQKSQFCGKQIPIPESNLFHIAKPATCPTCKIHHSPRFIPFQKDCFFQGIF